MDRLTAKIISLFLIFILMTIAGLLPIKVSDWYSKKGEKGRHYISVINCFGGGVFFGTYLMHMAPEVRFILEESLLEPNNIIYPIPELIIGFGFFLLLFVDKFVTIIAHRGAKNSVEPESIKSTDAIGSEVALVAVKHTHGYRADGHLSNSRAPSPRLVTRTHHDSVSSLVSRTRADSISSYMISELAHDAKLNGQVNIQNQDSKPNGDVNAHTHDTTLNGHVTSNGHVDVNVTSERARGLSVVTVDEKQPHEEPVEQTEDAALAARPYVFLIALSIDCIFEGMSLGLQDDAYGVLMLVIAILSHELVITFSFGLRLVKLFSTKKVALIILSYASTIPIGIIIGLSIYETGGDSNGVDIISGTFQAIAAGIFIYITFLEILNEELTHDAYLSKPVAVLIGFLFMASMVLVENIGTVGDEGSGEVNATANTLERQMFNFVQS